MVGKCVCSGLNDADCRQWCCVMLHTCMVPLPYQNLFKLAQLTERFLFTYVAMPAECSKIPLIWHPVIEEILLVWHLRRVVPWTEVLLFNRKKLHQWNSQISRTCSKMPPRVSVHLPLWYLMTPYPPVHQLLQLWRLQKRQKRALNQQRKGICKWNTPLISCRAQV